MKIRVPSLIAAAMVTWGCEKKEETQPVSAGVVPAPETKASPVPVPAPPAAEQPAPPETATPPAEAEVQGFLTDLDKLAQEVAKLPPNGPPPADVEKLQQSFTALMQRRGSLLARMNDEQKTKLMQQVAAPARIISPALVRLRLQQVKNASVPQPGTRQADPALGDLIPQPAAPRSTPPAPPPP